MIIVLIMIILITGTVRSGLGNSFLVSNIKYKVKKIKW